MIAQILCEHFNIIEGLLSRIANKSKGSEDIVLQYPRNASEMLVAPNTKIVPVRRRINKRLIAVTVSVPKNGIINIINNGETVLFFSDESGTLPLENGIDINDLVIEIINAEPSEAARFNYRLVFSE